MCINLKTITTRLAIGLTAASFVGCAATGGIKPPAVEIVQVKDILDVQRPALLNRLIEQGYQSVSFEGNHFEVAGKHGNRITVTINPENAVVTVYDVPGSELSPTQIRESVVSTLNFHSLPALPAAIVEVVDCSISAPKGVKLRNIATKVIGYAKHGEMINDCNAFEDDIPQAFTENKALSQYQWATGIYQGNEVIFAWNYVKEEELNRD